MTPDELADTLGIKPRTCVWLGGNERAARRLVEGALLDRRVYRPASGPIDVAIITAAELEEARYFLKKLAPRLTHETSVWILMRAKDESTCLEEGLFPPGSRADTLGDWRLASPRRAVAGFVLVRVERTPPDD